MFHKEGAKQHRSLTKGRGMHARKIEIETKRRKKNYEPCVVIIFVFLKPLANAKAAVSERHE